MSKIYTIKEKKDLADCQVQIVAEISATGLESYKTKALKALNKAQEKAKEWHKSPEGRQWHREHAAKTLWINKEKKILKCENCKNNFEAYRDNVARFCSKNCRQKGCYAKQKTLEKICLFCNEKFLANKYRNINCCSRLCSNRLKAQKKI